MSNSVDKKAYEHFVPEAKLDEGFPSNYNFVLLNTIEKLKEVLAKDFKYVAYDCETNGLDASQCFIVGYSFCFDGKTAYYIPVKHFSGGLGYEALQLIYAKLMSCKKVFMYNARFDIRFLEFAGFDCSKMNVYDVELAVVLADTNEKKSNLKWAERHFLGWVPDTFADTAGESMNFFFIEPEQGCFYAATDALGTFVLAGKTLQYYTEGGLSAKIEQNVFYPLMKMEDEPQFVDVDELRKFQIDASERLLELEKLIYKEAGYPFRINSNKEKAEALASLGITTGAQTKTGAMAVSIKVFESLLEKYEKAEEQPPKILSYLVEYSRLFKLQGSYINTLINEAANAGAKGLHFNYKLGKVPTGRLACGQDKDNPYFAHINLQSIPKPHPKNWYYRKAVPESDPKYTVYGWEFSLTPWEGEPQRQVEGKDPKLNLRDAFKAGEGRMCVVIDFSAQELRIPANLTLDPSFVRSFTTGGDPHTDTAIQMFGEENYDKAKRKIAKTFNFGLLYGMSTYSVADRYHVPIETAEKWVALYKAAHRQIFSWVDQISKKGRKEGTVYNFFGRPRRVRYYMNSADPKMRSFGYRTIVNTSVQSVGADMTKLVLTRYYKMVYNNPRFIDKDGHHQARFLETIHDEVGSIIDKVNAPAIIAECVHAQRLKIKNWPIPMDVGLELGNTWGVMFPFKVNQDTGEVLEPDGWDVESAEERETIDESPVDTEEDLSIDFGM